ncbi:MAG TPA: hypothetical protein VGQ24_15000 [Gemmatimonadales bacterium]|jgi:hypothetical protein|nr:hypothetical protein [Gemmatimonadales bacterium]
MQQRAIALVAALILGIAGLAVPPPLHAQAAATAATRAVQLESLSRERARHWAATMPALRCAPAPLTERPTTAAEFARPRVLPLEAAFLDAATVKRTFAARGGRIPRSN